MAAIPFWHRSQRRAIKIGHVHTKDASGRTDARHYFLGEQAETPPADIITDATLKQREWKQIKLNWPELSAKLVKVFPEMDWSQPVWFRPESLEAAAEEHDRADIDQVNKYWNDERLGDKVAALKEEIDKCQNREVLIVELRAKNLLPIGITVPSRRVSIRQAIGEFLEAKKARVFRAIGDRIDLEPVHKLFRELAL